MSCSDCTQLRKDVAEALRFRCEPKTWRWDVANMIDPQPEPLKACPVCGKQPEYRVDLHDIYCQHIGTEFDRWACMYTPSTTSEPEARRLWNTLPTVKP